MSDPPKRAAEKLSEWLHLAEAHESNKSAEQWLFEILELAEQDFSECRNTGERQRIYALIPATLHKYAAERGLSLTVTRRLYEALVAVARLEQGADELAPQGQRSARHSADVNFDRARLLLALERFPDKQNKVYAWAKQHLGLSRSDIRVLRNNYRQDEASYLEMRRHEVYLRQTIEAGDLWWLSDIL